MAGQHPNVVSKVRLGPLGKLMIHVSPPLKLQSGRSWMKMSVLVALGTLDPTFPPLTCCWSQRKKPRVRQYFQTQNTSLLTVIMTLDLEEISPEKQNSF